jgi:carbonic anhydrase/acetyltransferase-like protein (isoleucine patch superfamily)
MGATVLDGARIGARSIVGAGAVVTQRTLVPPGSMVLGTPAKVVRALSDAEQQALRGWADKYVEVAKAHAALQRLSYSP